MGTTYSAERRVWLLTRPNLLVSFLWSDRRTVFVVVVVLVIIGGLSDTLALQYVCREKDKRRKGSTWFLEFCM